MRKYNIGVVGCGVVGGSTIEIFKDHHEIWAYDKFKKGDVHGIKLVGLEIVVRKSEIVFISVPTPMKISGEIDLNPLYGSVQDVVDIHNKHLHFVGRCKGKELVVCVRSTAVSGTTDNLEKKFGGKNIYFAFQPEFLTVKNSIEDARHPDRIVIGANDKKAAKIIQQVYEYAGFSKKRVPYVLTDTKTAEMIKYFSNVLLASKVSMANEFYQICKKLDINYDAVISAVRMDKRIGKSHLNVPNGGDYGFGGLCFPKDLNALIYLAREHGYNPRLLEEVWETNLRVRKNRDWEKIEGAVTKVLEKGGEKP